MSPSSNYKLYREAISNADTPRIPYLGCWLQDITFIEESPDKLSNGMFNLEKGLPLSLTSQLLVSQTS